MVDGEFYIVGGRRVYKRDLYSKLEIFRRQKNREFKLYEQEMLEKLSALRGETGKTSTRAEKQDDNER